MSSSGVDIEQLRADIRHNEHELSVLGAARRDAHALAAAANVQRATLAQLNDESNGREAQLRQAASRIHSLHAQRDLMHQRRAAAASAAIAQQRRLNGASQPSAQLEELYGRLVKPVGGVLGHQSAPPPQQRPRASVGPFIQVCD